jgi:DNA-binding CsgD family transcriptional regulator/N-acetylneuraminic acid mutarotase
MANNIEMSERERDILKHVATGMSNKEIARTLQISTNTVKVHLRNIFAKIGVMSRTEATLYAIEHHIVDAPGNDGTTAGLGGGKQPFLDKNSRIIQLLIIIVLLGFIPLTWYLSSPKINGQNSSGNPTALPRWQSLTTLPEGRAGMAAVAYENQVYLFGGETENGITNTSLRYDNGSNDWQSIATKPTQVRDIQAVMIGERIFIPGGWTGTSSSRSLEVYDLRTDTWETAAPLPEARSGYALTALEGRIYLFGGWDGTQVTDDIYVYDPLEDQWSEMNPMKIARAYLKAINVDNKIYIFGGWDGRQTLTNSDLYIPARDKPGDQAWVALGPIPEGACRFSLANVSGYIILIGVQDTSCQPGQASGTLPKATETYYFSYQVQTNEWFSIEPSPKRIGSDSAIVAIENKIFSFGGFFRNSFLIDTQSFVAIYYASLPILLSP